MNGSILQRFLQFAGQLDGLADRPLFRGGVLLITATAAFLRIPEILLVGRFWAEGASVYFGQVYYYGFLDRLFTPLQGYYSLYNWLVSGLALLVPLERAPLVTGYVSFVVMLLPSFMVLFLPSYLGIRGWRRCVLGAAIAFPIINFEVWINVINCQFWFGLISALALFIDTKDRRIAYPLAGLLLLASLTGPITTFLLPFFLARAIALRDKAFYLHTAVVLIGAIVQTTLMVGFLLQETDSASYIHPLAQAYSLLIKLFLSPFMLEHSRELKRAALGHDQSTLLLAGLAAALCFLFVFWRACNSERRLGVVVLAAMVSVTTLSIFGSMSSNEPDTALARYLAPVAEGRYFLVGHTLLYVLLMLPQKGRFSLPGNLLAAVLMVLALNSAYYSYTNLKQQGHSWPDEIAAWRKNPNKTLVTLWSDVPDWRMWFDPTKER